MTGIAMAVATAPASAAPVPLSCTVTLTSSTGTDIVSGASGSLQIWSGGTHLVALSITGGSGSYPTQNLVFVSDGNTGTGTCSMGLSTDSIHQTIFWSGAGLGDNMSYHLTFDVTDSLGAMASARWPSGGSAVIQRGS